MFRTIAAACLALAVAAAVCLADDVKGTVKKVTKNTITVTVEDKDKTTDKTYDVLKDARILSATTTKNKKGKEKEKVTPIDAGLSGVKVGSTVVLTTEKAIVGEAEKDVVNQVKVTAPPAKKP